jgi:excisionase family DNA binding protein
VADLETGQALTNAEVLVGVRELVRRVERGDKLKPRLLDVTDSARYMGTSKKAIRAMIMRGELPHIQRIPGRSPYLVDVLDLDRWIARNKSKAS